MTARVGRWTLYSPTEAEVTELEASGAWIWTGVGRGRVWPRPMNNNLRVRRETRQRSSIGSVTMGMRAGVGL